MATKQRRRSTDREVTTVNLPGVTAEFHKPEHYIPTRDDLAGVVNTAREYLPSAQMTAFYGGLWALTALSVIEWPVAAAIGVGTAITGRASSTESESRSSRSRSS